MFIKNVSIEIGKTFGINSVIDGRLRININSAVRCLKYLAVVLTVLTYLLIYPAKVTRKSTWWSITRTPRLNILWIYVVWLIITEIDLKTKRIRANLSSIILALISFSFYTFIVSSSIILDSSLNCPYSNSISSEEWRV